MELDRLRAVPIFADLSDEDLSRLAQESETLRLGPEKVVTLQDEYAFKFFVILDGRLSVAQERQVIRELGPGDFFGEIGLLEVKGQTRTATVTTDTEVELLVFMEWGLHTIETDFPTVRERIRQKLQERLSADAERG